MQLRARADVRRQCPHGPHELLSGTPEVELAVVRRDLLCVGDAVFRLRLESRLILGEHALQQVGRKLCGAREDDARIVVILDRKRTLRGNRAGVQLLDGPVDRDSGRLVARHDRPLDRSSAAPARQQ